MTAPQIDLINLKDKVAVITGSSRGIGLNIAELFASFGAKIILNDLESSSNLTLISKNISEKFGVKTHFIYGDISKSSTHFELVKFASESYQKLDIFVNNAGILRDNIIGMIPEEDIDQTLSVNLSGVIKGIQAAARLMRKNKSGSIINISSIIGKYGNAGQLSYASSKAGVIGATLSAARELAPLQIRVNAIAPGFINTNLIQDMPRDKFEMRLNSIAMGRIGEPRDVANVALFLASDLSKYVTGQIIGVDGGMTI